MSPCMMGLSSHIMASNGYVVSVTAGQSHFLLLTADGKVLGMGSNKKNQLGLGAQSRQQRRMPNVTPVVIPFFDQNKIRIRSVCCGEGHSLEMSDQHVVYGWGRNKHGQCGMASPGKPRHEFVHTPSAIDIPSDADIVCIKCGASHSGCMSADQQVFLWGNNKRHECCVQNMDKV